jgi:hypothetical protein
VDDAVDDLLHPHIVARPPRLPVTAAEETHDRND